MTGFTLATEVRQQADVLLEDGFGKYKMFERLDAIPQSQSCESEWIGSKSQMGPKSARMY